MESAKQLTNLVKDHPRLELVGDPVNVFAQLCFYWRSGQEPRTADVDNRNTYLLYAHLTKQR